MNDHDLARSLSLIAEDLDGLCYANAGAVRQAARRLVELSDDAPGPGGCGRCGGAVVQPPTGRPRKFCTGCSPSRKSPRKVSHGSSEPN